MTATPPSIPSTIKDKPDANPNPVGIKAKHGIFLAGAIPVSPKVNSPRYDEPDCIEAVATEVTV
ncbi:MAG: hypothetical protein WBX25_00470 [Rhodomicrobium sp.]